jgi:hypothetical protein
MKGHPLSNPHPDASRSITSFVFNLDKSEVIHSTRNYSFTGVRHFDLSSTACIIQNAECQINTRQRKHFQNLDGIIA